MEAKKEHKGTANLRPIQKGAKGAQRAIVSAGGKASSAAQRKKKAIRAICNDLLGMELPEGAAELGALQQMAQDLAQQRGQSLDVYEALTLAQLAQALRGDTKAATFVRDSAGDKPTDQVAASVGVTAGDLALLRKLQEDLQHKDKISNT